MDLNDKYNLIIHALYNNSSNNSPMQISSKDFNLDYSEFEMIIDELEADELIKKGKWGINGEYIFMGLTFKGKNFIKHDDKKEYHKIEKTEIHNSIKIEHNNGIAVAGNNNIINNSNLNQRINELSDAIKNSPLHDKYQLIEELNYSKNNKEKIQAFIGKLLTRGAEVSTIIPIASKILELLSK